MQLDDFVATTLKQIVVGVTTAQVAVDEHGAKINPSVRSGTPGRFDPQTGTHIQDVEFDIAVTVSEGEKSGAGIRVGVPWISGGVEGGSDRQSSAVSRIRFSVPVLLPKHESLDP
jgi:hypothetical protein